MTHWRRLRFWETKSKLWWVWRQVLSLLLKLDRVNLSVGTIDGTLIQSFRFKQTTGYSGKHHHVGTKLSAVTDRQGLPLALVLAPGQRHDLPLAIPTLKRLRVGNRTRLEMVLTDKGFDSASLRTALRKRGIKTNIPRRQYQRRRKRGRPPKYDKHLGKERFVVERTNGWLKSFRRIRFRYDYTLASFRGLVLLSSIVVCVRRLVA